MEVRASESWCFYQGRRWLTDHEKTQDLFARQKNTWRGFEKATQDLFILNLRQTITQRHEKQHSVWEERREGFTDDKDAVHAELQRQLARPTQGQTSRRTLCDLRVQDLVGQNSQDLAQETDTSMDFWESRFLDSDPASVHQQGVDPEGESGETHDPDPPSRLSLSLEESQASEAAPGENMHSERDT